MYQHITSTTRSWVAVILLLLPSLEVLSQTPNTVINGVVADEKSRTPLGGATVHIKGTTHEVITDNKGRFNFITGQHVPVTFIISYLGYQTGEFYTEKATGNELLLKETTGQLNEVVVVGYGTQSRKNLVGSVAKINPLETKQIPVASFDAQLQGRAAGVQVNTYSGSPGEGVKVQIRGTASINASNEPLYVIDGVFVNNNSLSTLDLGGKRTSPLADINPADIESMEVLKDASAIAIYGSRGANGVILVNTKRGSYGSGTRYNLEVSQGWQKAAPGRLWKLTTGPEHAMLVNEQWINSGKDRPSLNQTYENRPFRPASEVINGVAGRGTPEEQQTYDRLSRVFRTARVSNYDFSVQGGAEKIRYNLGAGYTDQQGILKPADFKRGSFKLNLDARLSDRVTLGSSNGAYRTFRQQIRGGAGQQAGHLLAALHHPTYLPLYNTDGTPARGSLYENIDNLTNTDVVNISTTSIRYIGNQFLEVDIIKGLKFKTSVGLDYNSYDEREFFNDQTIIGGAPNPLGYRKDVHTTSTIFQNEQTLTYNRQLNSRQQLIVLLGNSFQTTDVKVSQLVGQGFPNNSFQQISAASVRTADQRRSQSTLASFFGRVNYNIDNKYFLEAVLRADGSSKFGANNRWGYFPGVGASWRAKQEDFLKDVESISELKVRISAGSAGNQNGINDYAALGLWSGTAAYPDNLTSGPKPGVAPAQLENPDLKWERTTTYNIGLDLGLLKDRLYINLDAYYKYTTDALLYLPVPQSTGYSSTLANAGEVSNKGIELAVTGNILKTPRFEWTANLNFARNINTAEKLVSPITFEAREYRRTEEGAPLGSFWLYKQLYVDAQTGDAVFQRADGSKGTSVTATDRVLLGNLIPDFFGGITNNFTYKGFDLNVFFSYQYGNKVYNFNKYILEGGGTRDASRSILASQLNRWQKPGDITNTPRLTSVGNNYNIEQNSRYLEDGSFIRLKTLSLGYTLPASVTRRLGLKKVRVYALGTNLWIATKYTGADPESSGSAGQNLDGLDTATPPQPRGIQFGANISF